MVYYYADDDGQMTIYRTNNNVRLSAIFKRQKSFVVIHTLRYRHLKFTNHNLDNYEIIASSACIFTKALLLYGLIIIKPMLYFDKFLILLIIIAVVDVGLTLIMTPSVTFTCKAAFNISL